jgi:hypothetical protein
MRGAFFIEPPLIIILQIFGPEIQEKNIKSLSAINNFGCELRVWSVG